MGIFTYLSTLVDHEGKSTLRINIYRFVPSVIY